MRCFVAFCHLHSIFFMVCFISLTAYAAAIAVKTEVEGGHDNRVNIKVIKYKIPVSAAKA